MGRIGRLFNNVWSGLATGTIVALAVAVPIVATAGTAVKLESSLGAANVTAGNTAYAGEVAATNDQVVKLQVFYKNVEKPADDNAANNLRMKVTLPADAGKDQVVHSSVKADNSEEATGQATVKLDQENARLQYIPGSAVWRHNTSDNDAPVIAETKLSDEIVLGAQGLVLENTKAGDPHAATVTVLVRVITPGVNITTESQLKGESNKWSANNSAQPGATLRHIISYQNTGNTEAKQLIVRDTLAAKVQLVPGTTKLFNTSNPNGAVLADTITNGGVNIGNYGPGANAYVTFETTLPPADQLVCGGNELRNISVIRPEGMSEYYATSITTIGRDCSSGQNKGAATPTPAPATPQPAYSCDLLTITKGDNRKISAKVDYKATNGAKLKMITYDFGDGSQPLVTDKTIVDYTYAKDGSFTVTAKLTVTANGKDETVTSAPCAQPVSFAPVAATPTTPAAPTSTKLPNSGAGDLVGLFVGASFVGFLAHRLLFARRVVHVRAGLADHHTL